MGVYRPKKTKYWHIDFYYKGRRYRESSESTRKRGAEQLLAKRKYELSSCLHTWTAQSTTKNRQLLRETIIFWLTLSRMFLISRS